MCLYPTMVKNRKYVKNKKNEGHVPSLPDRRVEYIPAGCGKCLECRKQKARGWLVRLHEDLKTHTNGKFVTLTFNNNAISNLLQHEIKRTDKSTGRIEKHAISSLHGYDKDNAIATRAVRLFTEAWRKKHKTSPRHWLVTELGHEGTENIHLHGIVWTNESIEEIRSHWHHGFLFPKPKDKRPNYVNEKTINYIVKYIYKQDKDHKEYRPIVLSSDHIGANYLNTHNVKKHDYNGKKTDELYITRSGHKISLPIYYRNKIYTEVEKERLWLDKLDENVRYVLKQKIDISNGDAEYKHMLKLAQEKNTRLGYGKKTDWDEKKYEEERRELLIKRRIQKK